MMSDQVICPLCTRQLFTAKCFVCGGASKVEKGIFDLYYALAAKLRDETQIMYQYFEIESLLLVNISLTQDPNRFQEYAVFRRTEEGGYTKVESVTVNAKQTHLSDLTGLFMSISKQPMSDFEAQIRAYDDHLTYEEFESFKQRFAAYEKTC